VLPAHHCISNACQVIPPTASPSSTRQGPVNSSFTDRRHCNVVKMLCMLLVPTHEQSRSCPCCEQKSGILQASTLFWNYLPGPALRLCLSHQGWSFCLHFFTAFMEVRISIGKVPRLLSSMDRSRGPEESLSTRYTPESSRIRLQGRISACLAFQRVSLAVALNQDHGPCRPLSEQLPR
jgi:hypothetical protein